MKKTLIAIAAVAALMGAGCKDNDLKRDRAGDNFGDAKPDNGHEGFFENDGINDNTEKNDGIGGSGDLDNNDPIDIKADEKNGKVKVDVETEKD